MRDKFGRFVKGHLGYRGMLGKKFSKEYKEKLSRTFKEGYKNGTRVSWNKGKTGFYGYWTGKKRNSETIEKIRIANIGRKQSKVTKEKRSETLKRIGHRPPVMFGKENPIWKGNKAGSDAMHKWVYSKKDKAKICDICGKKEGKIEWCNKDHTYKRKLDDYISLCTSCHRKWDIKYNNYKGGMTGLKHSEKSKQKMKLKKLGKHFSLKTEFKKGMTPWNKK